jgi:hypothetical protein
MREKLASRFEHVDRKMKENRERRARRLMKKPWHRGGERL